MKEHSLLQEMDELSIQELAEKRSDQKQTEISSRRIDAGLEDKIRAKLSSGVIRESGVWAVTLKERPFRSEDYSLKLHPVWSREGSAPGEIISPLQIAIDNTTQNIFVTDYRANTVQVFNEEGKHLYKIPTAQDQLVKIRKSTCKFVKSVQTEKSVWGIDIDTNTNIYGCEHISYCV